MGQFLPQKGQFSDNFWEVDLGFTSNTLVPELHLPGLPLREGAPKERPLRIKIPFEMPSRHSIYETLRILLFLYVFGFLVPTLGWADSHSNARAIELIPSFGLQNRPSATQTEIGLSAMRPWSQSTVNFKVGVQTSWLNSWSGSSAVAVMPTLYYFSGSWILQVGLGAQFDEGQPPQTKDWNPHFRASLAPGCELELSRTWRLIPQLELGFVGTEAFVTPKMGLIIEI